MALEPVVVTADTGPSPELADMTRRFWIALVLSIPVIALEVGGHLFPSLHEVVSPSASTWVQLVLATPVVLWAGWPFFARGWVSVRTMNLNMFTLIAMGTGVAWLYSVIATLAPGASPSPTQSRTPPPTRHPQCAQVLHRCPWSSRQSGRSRHRRGTRPRERDRRTRACRVA